MVRKSNIELLRIVAMILVMLVHIFPGTIGFSHQRMMASPVSSIVCFGIEAISIVCVNVFVFISGWFGIRISSRKIGKLCFQVLFYSVSIFAVLIILNPKVYLNVDMAGTILCLHTDDYWFVKAYIGLAILSPALNAFVDNVEERVLRWVLTAFFAFQTIYAWLSITGAGWFSGGYSAMSFLGIYLLAQYIKRYGHRLLLLRRGQWGFVFGGIAGLQTLLASILTYLNIPIAGRLFTYTNPLVIIQSVALFMLFRTFDIRNQFINHIAGSCLAVYLLHGHPLLLHSVYGSIIREWFTYETTWNFIIFTSLFVAAWFVMAILSDQVRLWIYRHFETQKQQ